MPDLRKRAVYDSPGDCRAEDGQETIDDNESLLSNLEIDGGTLAINKEEAAVDKLLTRAVVASKATHGLQRQKIFDGKGVVIPGRFDCCTEADAIAPTSKIRAKLTRLSELET